ncbi:MAG: Endonuclease [Crocinitomicaceae bacterium]|jgi:endonuclease I/DNA/RNA endonuclease YhcR with UshA esterase domain|nr:Endonuclease [Crocinitomicaceae bacterium]
MKNKILIGFALLSSCFYAQDDILDARNNFAIGQTVTVRGVATNGSELGSIRYLQDATGAIAAYGSSLSGVGRGDSISVTGVLMDFNGLLEISPVNSHQNIQNVGIPVAPAVPITLVNESIEARLIKIENVTFVETGSFVANTNYNLTDGTNTLQLRVTTGTNLVGTAIPTGPVSVTGLVGQFQTNYQILPRDLNDVVTYVAPQQEINVTIGGNTILTNGTYVVGNATSTTVTVQNYGVGTLSVTGAVFSGTDAADFGTDLTTLSIAGGSSATFNILYTPNGNGSRSAVIEIASDDADENPYMINLSAVGVDGLADEPMASATNLDFSNEKAWTFTLNFDGVPSAEKYLVLWKNGSAPTDLPVDGTNYMRGDYIGTSKVAASGVATAIVPRGVIANQTYYFAIYPYNGPAGFENYLTTAPLTGNVTSAGSNVGSYYAGITSAEPTLITELTAKVNPHTVVTYAAYKSTVMQNFEVKDTTDGQSYVTCAYSGENKVFTDPFDWSTIGYSREHSFAHSWMPTFDASTLPEYADQHNLYPTNLQQANTPRSNLPMDEVTGTVLFNYLEGTVGLDDDGQMCYEPRAKQKGNAARAMFYMCVAYNGIGGESWVLPSGQDQMILKEWHFADTPDNYEIARHELMFNNQNNRNPFIDSADFVCFIDFATMTYNVDACTLGEKTLKLDEKSVVVFPNPAKDVIYLQVNGTEIKDFTILDLQGREIVRKKGLNSKYETLNTSEFKAGTYIVTVNTPLGSVQTKFVVE